MSRLASRTPGILPDTGVPSDVEESTMAESSQIPGQLTLLASEPLTDHRVRGGDR